MGLRFLLRLLYPFNTITTTLGVMWLPSPCAEMPLKADFVEQCGRSLSPSCNVHSTCSGNCLKRLLQLWDGLSGLACCLGKDLEEKRLESCVACRLSADKFASS